MHPISILITDDHSHLRKVLTLLFNTDNRFSVVGECNSGEEAIEKANVLKPQIFLMDINLPGINGFEACEIILRGNPAAKVLGMSINAEAVYASKMISCGGRGYMTKSSPPDEFFDALIAIHQQRKYVCHAIRKTLIKTLGDSFSQTDSTYTVNQEEIIFASYLRLGFKLEDIMAVPEFSSINTEFLLLRLLKKLNLPDVESLIHYCKLL